MRVLISGAGIAGPALAWWLARLNAHVTVVDIRSDFLSQGQNIDLTGAAITIIKRMGLEARIKEMNTTEKGTRIQDVHGRTLASFDVTETGPSPTSPYEILRGDLALILADATRHHPNVTYKFGMGIKDILSDDDRGIAIQLTSGDRAEFDLVVAADGQWSGLRKKCFDPSTVEFVDKNMYIGYFTVPRVQSDTDYWRIYWPLKRRIVTARPDPHGTIRVALTIMPLSGDQKDAWEAAARGSQKAQKNLLRSEFADVKGDTPRFLRALDKADDFYLQGVKQVKMTKWSTGRVICLGDAAYAPTPLTGMGTSLAITGAYVLAGHLGELGEGEHPGKAFAAFETTFRPFVEQSQQLSFLVPVTFHPRVAWQRWLLETFCLVVSRVLTIPWLANIFADNKSPEAEDGGFPMPSFPSLD